MTRTSLATPGKPEATLRGSVMMGGMPVGDSNRSLSPRRGHARRLASPAGLPVELLKRGPLAAAPAYLKVNSRLPPVARRA